ncbi:MAG: aminoacyl-tRNA hydrolase [Actinomycetales bacterium]|nr:MAG: aminoacyl-tRNA hydrolase [Actinomycetales bacterium]
MNLWLVVGLGNPGPAYTYTRHNIGFFAVDELAGENASFTMNSRMRSQLCQVVIPSVPGKDAIKLLLAKPNTFMNNSGVAVSALAAYYKIPTDQIVIIHDELDLDPGRLRIKFGGGDNGHNGLKSIRQHLHTGDFYRVRCGIGRPPGRQAASNWVLANVNDETLEQLVTDAAIASDAVISLVSEGLVAAQNSFNN